MAISEWRVKKSEWGMVSGEWRRVCGARSRFPFAIHYSPLTAAIVALAVLSGLPAFAQAPSFSSSPFRFTQADGETIYRNVCAGCHMPDGRGAVGAGAYPSLIRNSKLEAAGYPLTLVMNGRKAMPAFGIAMTDAQVAAVVNYVRTHFGNAYTDAVTANDVKSARQ